MNIICSFVIFQKNNSLKTLNLAWNGFSVKGSKAMGEALAKNSCLQQLDLSSNRICMEAAAKLVKGLQNNETLCAIKVSKISIWSYHLIILLLALLITYVLLILLNKSIPVCFKFWVKSLQKNLLYFFHPAVWKSINSKGSFTHSKGGGTNEKFWAQRHRHQGKPENHIWVLLASSFCSCMKGVQFSRNQIFLISCTTADINV